MLNTMETRQLQTESYMFESPDGLVRAIPFYELSIDECIVYQDGQPQFLIDFNRRTKPLILDLTAKLQSGESLDDLVQKLGKFLGRQWTTKHNIQGEEVPNSQKTEVITLQLLDNLTDLLLI